MCDPTSPTFTCLLEETELFRITGDANPLTEGHILIIPRQHVDCIANYDATQLQEYRGLHDRVAAFVKRNYGSVATFEHGKFGQTVYHSHVHVLPFTGSLDEIVPEGLSHAEPLENISELKQRFERDGGYLYVSVDDEQFTIDKTLVARRFFRDRFASALHVQERGDWKQTYDNPALRSVLDAECDHLRQKWLADRLLPRD